VKLSNELENSGCSLTAATAVSVLPARGDLSLPPADAMKAEEQSEPEKQAIFGKVVGGELKTLAQHSSHYLAGMVVSLAVGFISFPIFTHVL